MPLRSNLWLELQVSNNELAGIVSTQNQTSGVYHQYHPASSDRECADLSRMGELKYMARKKDLVLSYVRNHPGRFARMSIERAVAFWFPPPLRLGQAILAWIITCLALLGLWQSFRNNRVPAQLIGLVWLCFPLLYYLVAIDNRYRYPIYWSFLLMAVAGMEAIRAWGWRRSHPITDVVKPQTLTCAQAGKF